MNTANLDPINNCSNPGLSRLENSLDTLNIQIINVGAQVPSDGLINSSLRLDIMKRSHFRCRKLYYVVEVDRRPPKKTPIKMAGAAAAKKADRAVVEAKRPAATQENEGGEGTPDRGGAAGDGDDVRETSC